MAFTCRQYGNIPTLYTTPRARNSDTKTTTTSLDWVKGAPASPYRSQTRLQETHTHTHSAPTVCRTCSALRLQSASGQLLKLLPHMSNSLSRSCVRRANWNTACHVWHGVVSCWDTADTHAAEVRSWTQKPFCLLCFNLKSGFTQQPTWVQKDFL